MPIFKDNKDEADVGITDFCSLYFKLQGKDIKFWQDKHIIQGEITRDKSLFKDNYMELFAKNIPPNAVESIRTLDDIDPILGLANAIRHRYFNKSLARVIKHPIKPVKQIILLGAGFDTRPIRKKHYNAIFFEVDQSKVLSYKQQVYKSNNIPNNAISIEIDYVKEDLLKSLLDTGLDLAIPTHIIWEGKVFYLPIEIVEKVINLFKVNFNAPLTLSFDYHAGKTVRKETEYPKLTEFVEHLTKQGTPLQSGIDNIYEFAKKLGISVIDDYNATQLMDLYGVDDKPNPILSHYHCCTLKLRSSALFESGIFAKGEYSYSFSRNADDLKAYYKLLKELYIARNGIVPERDEYDIPGDILIIKKSNKVVGGIRLTVSSKDAPRKLKLEKYGINLQAVLPDISQYKYGEFSRFCLAAEKNTDVSETILQIICKEADRRGCSYLVADTFPSLINYYKQKFAKVGYQIISTPYKYNIMTHKKGRDETVNTYLMVANIHEKTLPNKKVPKLAEPIQENTLRSKL